MKVAIVWICLVAKTASLQGAMSTKYYKVFTESYLLADLTGQ
jgi:hypothetical protein